MRVRLFVAALMSVMVLIRPGIAVSQSVPPSGTLTVNGHTGEAPVIQANGQSYVDVEALARITNGSIRFNGNQILLTLPAPTRGARMTVPARQGGAAPAAPAPPAPVAQAGFSKDFLRAGIEAMAEIREWRSALETAVRYGFPPGDSWINSYSGPAATGISLASAAASTDDDRQGFQLLNNVFNNMQSLSNQMLQRRKNMNYIAPDALQNDPLDQKILACGHALAAMAAAERFQDNGACH